MLDVSGLALQLGSKVTTLGNVDLLIVANNDDMADVEAIVNTLGATEINFNYDFTTVIRSYQALSQKSYDAILYICRISDIYTQQDSPLRQIKWWFSYLNQIPLILITDTLGDEVAVECVQAGVKGYVLWHKLSSLPIILNQVLRDFPHKIEQQDRLEQIKQQQAYIQQLEQERRSWEAAQVATEEYISHLSHELRNPITAVLGFAKMLREEIYGALNAKQMQYVGAITTGGEHLLELVNNYLALAKIEANKEEIYREKLLIEEICQVAISLVQGKAREKGLELIFHLEEGLDFCWADKLKLKQILVNLLSNGIKFTKQGSVTVDVKQNSAMIEFSVIDTGIGISPENLQKLFQPFQQLNSRHEGTGLGLALSRKLAQLHQGDITVASEWGKGTCFTLHLPYPPQDQGNH